jgi:hypothetical protein
MLVKRFIPKQIISNWLVIVLSFAMLMINALLLGYILWSSYTETLTKARQETLFASDFVASQFRSTINSLEIMLNETEHGLQYAKLTDITPLDNKVTNYLLKTKSIHKHLMDILIVNPQGIITQWTGQGIPPKVLDRAYVTQHLNSQSSALFIGEPLLSKVHKNQWFFALSLPIRNTQGKLLRIIYSAQ